MFCFNSTVAIRISMILVEHTSVTVLQIGTYFRKGKSMPRFYQFVCQVLLIFSVSINITATADGDEDINGDLPCAPKNVEVGKNKIVCICNETYCDNLGPITIPERGHFIIYTSDKDGNRLRKTSGLFGHRGNCSFADNVLGFGGAFTDASGINLAKLSSNLQKKFLQSYFGPNGIGYTLGRIPIGGTDFSTRPYTYDDNHSKADVNLTFFSLQNEDFNYKIPFIKWAKMLDPTLLLYASPWTASPWMKTNRDFKGRGMLNKQYQKVWANYIVRFLQEYKANGVGIWGLTTQNEPIDGLIPFFPFNSMGWTASMQRDWVKNYLGPTLHANGFQELKLMILDDNAILLPSWAKTVLSDPEASKFVSGIGVHWYTRRLSGYNGISKTLKLFPDKFILATEACTGFLIWEKNVDLGSWERGEEYAEDIMQELSHGASGWTDWNIALDIHGGPNWDNMGADSPIIVAPEKNEFYKQPMFYSLAHFSKFFTRHSKIISVRIVRSTSSGRSVPDASSFLAVAAERVDNVVVVGLLNKNEFPIVVHLFDATAGAEGTAIIDISPKSISTVLYLKKLGFL